MVNPENYKEFMKRNCEMSKLTRSVFCYYGKLKMFRIPCIYIYLHFTYLIPMYIFIKCMI